MSFGAARVAPEKAVFRPVLPMSLEPGISEMRMAKTAYWEKLKDPRWQKLRLKTLEAAGWRCAQCSDTDSTLHVHHRQYFKGREPWEYEVGQLEVLCEGCHEAEHDSTDPLMLAASFVPTIGYPSREQVASLIAGFCGHSMNCEYVADPPVYLAGRTAELLEQSYQGLLLDLCEALQARDRFTITAAVDAFVADLRTRPAAAAPDLPAGLDDL